MGWFAIALICIVILFIILSAYSRRGSKKRLPQRSSESVPPQRQNRETAIRRLLDLAYMRTQRLKMKYETGNPLPEEPAIKIRDIDIYGLGDEYIEAYCHYRSEVRTFKISRILWANLLSEIYQIPQTYTPNTWVTEGWGEIEDGTLVAPVEAGQDRSHLSTLEDTRDTYDQDEQRQTSREKLQYGRIDDSTRSYTRHDWQKRFDESILTPFPEEWSPALPYLHEAHKLEEAGADQAKIQKVLEKAHGTDKDATAFYLGRMSIIRKVRSKKRQNRQQLR